MEISHSYPLGQDKNQSEEDLSVVDLSSVLSSCILVTLLIVILICAKTKNKQKKEVIEEDHGTLEATDNDSYVDPEAWVGTREEPIMGHNHSSHSTKNKVPQPPSVKSSEGLLPSAPSMRSDLTTRSTTPQPQGETLNTCTAEILPTTHSAATAITDTKEEDHNEIAQLAKWSTENESIQNDQSKIPPRSQRSSNVTEASDGSRSNRESKISQTSSNTSEMRYKDVNHNKLSAEEIQDKALAELGLYRFKIPGDGNCLFRAVASQLRLPQARFHLLLRKAAAQWIHEHKDELYEEGLLEDDDEIKATETEGRWPGHAAIVALANLLHVNIAVVQGGERGEIDIEHIEPNENVQTDNGDDQGNVILSYMFNGHYDAIVNSPDAENSDYASWKQKQGEMDFASETLARKLQAEEDAKVRQIQADAEYSDMRYARAIANRERREAEEAAAEQQRADPVDNVKLMLLANRVSGLHGITEEPNHYDTINEDYMNPINNRNHQDNNSIEDDYEYLVGPQDGIKSDKFRPPFNRQRSLSLTTSIKLQVNPNNKLTRARSQSLTDKGTKTIKEYTESDLKRFLTPLSATGARRKFAYLDIM